MEKHENLYGKNTVEILKNMEKYEYARENQENLIFLQNTRNVSTERVDPSLEKSAQFAEQRPSARGCRPPILGWRASDLDPPPPPTSPRPPSETYAPRIQGHPFQS